VTSGPVSHRQVRLTATTGLNRILPGGSFARIVCPCVLLLVPYFGRTTDDRRQGDQLLHPRPGICQPDRAIHARRRGIAAVAARRLLALAFELRDKGTGGVDRARHLPHKPLHLIDHIPDSVRGASACGQRRVDFRPDGDDV